jgi:serine/threonine protein kinase
LEQLHWNGVAHQDLKPSNVLIFNGKESKIGDFGKAALRDAEAPHDHEAVAGDKAYAPPELLYDAVAPGDWNCRRYGCDMYLVGSLIVFVFSRITLTSAIVSKMHIEHRPPSWGGTFADVMPYLRDAFDKTVIEFQDQLPQKLKELSVVVRQLGDPDPKLRGHPSDRIGHRSQYSLERYVSIFDRLAKLAELGLLKS